MKYKAHEQFKSGQLLFGKEGVFAPMLKHFLEVALQAEMDAHLVDFHRSWLFERRENPLL